MKPRFSIHSILLFTAMLALLAAICEAIPVFERRDLEYTDFGWTSVVPRRPTTVEAAIRFAWSAPVVSLWFFMFVRQRRLRCARISAIENKALTETRNSSAKSAIADRRRTKDSS